MKYGKGTVTAFLIEKLKNSILTAIVFTAILAAFFRIDLAVAYVMGTIIGMANFCLLTVGMNLLLIIKVRFPLVIQFLFFTLRYLIIAYLAVNLILNYKENPFAVCGGLLTMNFSIFIFELLKTYRKRKEG